MQVFGDQGPRELRQARDGGTPQDSRYHAFHSCETGNIRPY